MPAPSRVYVWGTFHASLSGHRRQSANGQLHVGTGLLHCDLCAVFCMSDTILEHTERLLALLAAAPVVRLVSLQMSHAASLPKGPVKKLRMHTKHRNEEFTNYVAAFLATRILRAGLFCPPPPSFT